MNTLLRTFHYLSYATWPVMGAGLFFIYRALLFEVEDLPGDVSLGLMLNGLALSLVSMKSSNKTSKMEKFVYEKPFLTKVYVFSLLAFVIFGIIMSIIGYFRIEDIAARQMAIGLFTFCIGGFSFLKMFLDLVKTYHFNKETPDFNTQK